RAAACGVDHYDLDLSSLECVNVTAGVIERLFLFSSVDQECPAAALISGNRHLATFFGQHTGGGGVYFREQDSLHASKQYSDTQAPFSLGLHTFRQIGVTCFRRS